ncbi:MAG: tetratricopeptide repeat protein [Deltaproteobacteria bacterium]|nr:tetratricopeptide repeat protein [Deltaproteobacteria bacterium]
MTSHSGLKLISCLLLLAGLGILTAGCAGHNEPASARGLTRDELDEMMAKRDAQEDARLNGAQAKDPLEMEKRGDAMVMAGNLEGAQVQYQRAVLLARDPEQKPRLHGKIAQLSLQARQFPQAEKLFESLTQDLPGNAMVWQGLGLAQLGQGDLTKAQKALEKAVTRQPSLWKAHNALGIIYNSQGKPEQALAAFDQAVAQGPRLAQLYNNRALAYVVLNHLDQAEADFRQALNLDPNFKLASNNLALLLARRGNLPGAFQAFAQANGEPQAHNNLGVWLAWQGSYAQAVEQFKNALMAMPRYYPLADSHLAQLAARGISPAYSDDTPQAAARSLSQGRPPLSLPGPAAPPGAPPVWGPDAAAKPAPASPAATIAPAAGSPEASWAPGPAAAEQAQSPAEMQSAERIFGEEQGRQARPPGPASPALAMAPATRVQARASGMIPPAPGETAAWQEESESGVAYAMTPPPQPVKTMPARFQESRASFDRAEKIWRGSIPVQP